MKEEPIYERVKVEEGEKNTKRNVYKKRDDEFFGYKETSMNEDDMKA